VAAPAILWKIQMDKSPLQFRPVPPDQVDAVWPAFAPMLARCQARGEWAVDDIRGWLLVNKMQLLGVFEDGKMIAGLVYGVLAYPKMRVFQAYLLAGDGGFQWGGGMLRAIEKIAADNGCAKVKFEGREEWRRVLAPAGYEAVSVSYEKVIVPCSARNAA
jgi:hypothetical protein